MNKETILTNLDFANECLTSMMESYTSSIPFNEFQSSLLAAPIVLTCYLIDKAMYQAHGMERNSHYDIDWHYENMIKNCTSLDEEAIQALTDILNFIHTAEDFPNVVIPYSVIEDTIEACLRLDDHLEKIEWVCEK